MSLKITKASSPKISANKPLKELSNLFLSLEKDLGKEVALTVFYLFAGRKIWIPSDSSIQRLIRNQQILQQWRSGISVADLSCSFNLSQSWIRTIIKRNLNTY